MSRDLLPDDEPMTPPIGPGLRLRLWAGCLSGSLLAGAGVAWVLWSPDTPVQPDAVFATLVVSCGLSLVVGAVLALWLDHHLTGHLRGLIVGLRSGRSSDLRGLPADFGWGELSALGDAVQESLDRQVFDARAVADLDRTRRQMAELRARLEAWVAGGEFEPTDSYEGEVGGLAALVAAGAGRSNGADEAQVDAARRLAAALTVVVREAHDVAAQAERGFVEATSLQTSVRELQRLSGELDHALAASIGAPATGPDPIAERARQALEDLVEASATSVDSLGQGLLRVHDISELVQRLANRATLIAIQTLSGTGDPATVAEELKHLARDVREATDRTQAYTDEIDAAVTAADAAMREARTRAIERLSAPEPVEAAPTGARAPDTARLMERVLEMVRDASAKGERVSAASERASSMAERIARRLEGDATIADTLAARYAAPEEPAATEPEPAPALRLVDEAHTSADADARRSEERP